MLVAYIHGYYLLANIVVAGMIGFVDYTNHEDMQYAVSIKCSTGIFMIIKLLFMSYFDHDYTDSQTG